MISLLSKKLKNEAKGNKKKSDTSFALRIESRTFARNRFEAKKGPRLAEMRRFGDDSNDPDLALSSQMCPCFRQIEKVNRVLLRPSTSPML
jgi:hypothetical protein